MSSTTSSSCSLGCATRRGATRRGASRLLSDNDRMRWWCATIATAELGREAPMTIAFPCQRPRDKLSVEIQLNSRHPTPQAAVFGGQYLARFPVFAGNMAVSERGRSEKQALSTQEAVVMVEHVQPNRLCRTVRGTGIVDPARKGDRAVAATCGSQGATPTAGSGSSVLGGRQPAPAVWRSRSTLSWNRVLRSSSSRADRMKWMVRR